MSTSAEGNSTFLSIFEVDIAKASTPTTITSSVSLIQNGIPLVDIFTPPRDCTAASAYAPTIWAGNQVAYTPKPSAKRPACYPTLSAYNSGGLWYSPGVCPTGYNYVATTSILRTQGSFVTMAYCCPPGIYSGGIGAGSSGYTCFHVYPGTTVFGDAISVAWAESDLPLFTPASAPVLELEKAGVTLTQVSPSDSMRSMSNTAISTATDRNNASSSRSTGLSTGGAAGIGVGASIFGLAILGVLSWLLWRHRNKVAKQHLQQRAQHLFPEIKGSHGGSKPPQLIDSNPRYEVENNAIPLEMDAGLPPEMDAGYYGIEATNGVRSPA